MDSDYTIQIELQLAGWSQTHNGGSKLTFWVSDDDLEPFKTATVKKGRLAGQRYMAVLVELDDNEQPKMQGEKKKHALTASAAVLCKTPLFQRFCESYSPMNDLDPEAHAATVIRNFCRVDSRKDLDTSEDAATAFGRLMHLYREWQEETV